jgi:hypothetical protein
MATRGETGRVVRVPADHPAWAALDDDDWNGATFSSWLGRLKGKSVLIWPPADYGDKLGRFLAALLNAGVERIVDGATQPVNERAFCGDCLPLAEDMEDALNDLYGTLRRLADAAEAALSSEPDMPTYESTMDEFDNTLDEARQLLREIRS